MSQCSVQQFNLSDVPAGLKRCVYKEEAARGFVKCPRSVYMIVLALRHLLTESKKYLDSYDHYETPKVFWRWHDEYGFRTDIIIFRDKVEEWDPYIDDMSVTQKFSWHELATVRCQNGEGVITHVDIDTVPYGRIEYGGDEGVRRLIDDAAHAQRAHRPWWGDTSRGWEIYHDTDWHTRLSYTLGTEISRYGVTVDVDVENITRG